MRTSFEQPSRTPAARARRAKDDHASTTEKAFTGTAPPGGTFETSAERGRRTLRHDLLATAARPASRRRSRQCGGASSWTASATSAKPAGAVVPPQDVEVARKAGIRNRPRLSGPRPALEQAPRTGRRCRPILIRRLTAANVHDRLPLLVASQHKSRRSCLRHPVQSYTIRYLESAGRQLCCTLVRTRTDWNRQIHAARSG